MLKAKIIYQVDAIELQRLCNKVMADWFDVDGHGREWTSYGDKPIKCKCQLWHFCEIEGNGTTKTVDLIQDEELSYDPLLQLVNAPCYSEAKRILDEDFDTNMISVILYKLKQLGKFEYPPADEIELDIWW